MKKTILKVAFSLIMGIIEGTALMFTLRFAGVGEDLIVTAGISTTMILINVHMLRGVPE